ncbi:MAG: ATPase domain-containing protein [Candidatus Thermoplasmatota archaeon]
MRVQSGIAGLDELIEDGFPQGTINLVCGPAGSAKSLFGLQFAYGGVLRDERGVFLALEESRENVLRAAEAYGFDVEGEEKKGRFRLLDMGEVRASCSSAEEMEMHITDFASLTETARSLAKNFAPQRLVVDSISAVSLQYQRLEEFRRELFRFCRALKEMGVTTLLISETPIQGEIAHGAEHFVADAVIVLGYENVKGEYRRTLTVYKMRFTRHDPYKHPFLIGPNGIEVDPEEVIY